MTRATYPEGLVLQPLKVCFKVSPVCPFSSGPGLRQDGVRERGFPPRLCASFTTARPLPPGGGVDLVIHGPPQDEPSGATVQYGYGFQAELTADGTHVTYGLDRLGSHAPRRLRAAIGRGGNTISVSVPRTELDRAPANMPGRPPFPHRRFLFEARARSAPNAIGGQVADFAPNEDEGKAGYVRGKLCAAPCAELGP